MIIGITGTMAAGKGVASDYLKTKGFEYFSYSDILRKIAHERGIEPIRQNLQKLGNTIKEEAKNQGILSKKILEAATTSRVVAEGIRNPPETREFRKAKDFHLLAIVAPPAMRYKRILSRGRHGDPATFAAFKRLDASENRGATRGQQVNRCIAMADVVIENTGTIGEFHKKIDDALAAMEGSDQNK